MFQSYMLFKAYSYYSSLRKENTVTESIIYTNSMLPSEGEEATATCLGKRPSRGGILIIHRASSVEEATATCLGNPKVTKTYIKINRKNAPNGLSPNSNQTKKER